MKVSDEDVVDLGGVHVPTRAPVRLVDRAMDQVGTVDQQVAVSRSLIRLRRRLGESPLPGQHIVPEGRPPINASLPGAGRAVIYRPLMALHVGHRHAA